MICYRCGTDAGHQILCPTCGADLTKFHRVYRISNAYYNDGLQKAEVRNLSGAVESLKKSLKFNKYNVKARNLLGLVYYEMGEVVGALSEWIISTSHQQNDNLAHHYLEEIRQNRSQLDTINQTIKKYNQALLYCKQDSRDLAIIQLKKVLALNPKLVKGHQLLALLYIQEEKLELAKKTLRQAGKIDTNNTTTLRYLREVNIRMKEKGHNKKKQNDDLISYQSGNETIIMPKRFKETSVGSTLIAVLIGLLVGAAVTSFLVVPNAKNKAKNEAKKQLLEANDLLSSDGQTISGLEKQIEDLQAQLDTANINNEQISVRFGAYETLTQAYLQYVGGDVIGSANTLGTIDTTMLSENAMAQYNSLNAIVEAPYLEQMYNQGYAYYSQENFTEAINCLKAVVDRNNDYEEGYAIYYLAQSYRRGGDAAAAKPYYQYVIDHYPNTERAATSQNYVNE